MSKQTIQKKYTCIVLPSIFLGKKTKKKIMCLVWKNCTGEFFNLLRKYLFFPTTSSTHTCF